jgi:uncharacterized membrane protein HdeD (DUF308 family)
MRLPGRRHLPETLDFLPKPYRRRISPAGSGSAAADGGSETPQSRVMLRRRGKVMSSFDTPGFPDGGDFRATVRKSLREHWLFYLVEGIILAILGLAAMLAPPFAGLATTIFLGWLFVIGGGVGLVSTLGARRAPGFLWALLSALVALVAGGLLLWNPLRGLVTLTYVLIAFFFIDGILTIALAVEHRRELSRRWEWMLLGGVMDLLLAGFIIWLLPGASAWVLGFLVGIDLVFGGTTLIGMALSARNAA